MIRRVVVVVAGLVSLAAAASAQEPVSSFDALAGRVQVGQRIWVTDSTGREVRGTLERLSSDGLVLAAKGRLTFAAPDVRRVRARDRDSLKNGTLIGLGIGTGIGTAWCVGAIADNSGDIDARVECAEGAIFGGLGTLLGWAIDRATPGRMRILYRAPGSDDGASLGGLELRPLVEPHKRGIVARLTF